jgi:type VI secretion system protein ImpG
LEVYRVDRVRLRSTGTGHERAQDLPAGRGEGQAPGWVGQRRPSSLPDDPATDLAVRLVDAHLRPCSAASATLELQLTCSNRLLPAAIPFMGGQEDRFQLPRHAVLAGAWPLGRPTPGLPPPAGSGQSWRFLGLLLMNQASLVALDAGALQDLLAIHGFADGAGAARRIRAIRRVTARPVTAVLPEPSQPRCARGLEVELALDEQHLEPGEPFLLALVLEPFLARLCPAGSFIQLRLTDRHDEPLTLRPPVPGEGATL